MENLPDFGEPLKGGLLDNLSRFTGESPEATQRAFHAALPASMYAISDYGSTASGASSLLDGFRGGKLPELGVESLGSVLSDWQATDRWSTAGGSFLDKILGPKLNLVLGALSNSAGVTLGAMAKIVSLAAPLPGRHRQAGEGRHLRRGRALDLLERAEGAAEQAAPRGPRLGVRRT